MWSWVWQLFLRFSSQFWRRTRLKKLPSDPIKQAQSKHKKLFQGHRCIQHILCWIFKNCSESPEYSENKLSLLSIVLGAARSKLDLFQREANAKLGPKWKMIINKWPVSWRCNMWTDTGILKLDIIHVTMALKKLKQYNTCNSRLSQSYNKPLTISLDPKPRPKPEPRHWSYTVNRSRTCFILKDSREYFHRNWISSQRLGWIEVSAQPWMTDSKTSWGRKSG